MSDVVWPTEPPTEVHPPPPPEAGSAVAAAWTRVGEVLLELVLMACTFGFGWVGWWIIAWADGQTPAKVVLHVHVVNDEDGRVASFGRMATREVVGKGIAGVLGAGAVYFGLTALAVLVAVYVVVSGVVALTDDRRRTLWDRLAKTVVVEGDPPPILTRQAVVGTEPV